MCLGDVYDPFNTTDRNSDIIQKIANSAHDFDSFESRIYHVSGRWLILVSIGDETRLYPDASGLRPAFYSKLAGDLWVGSQPGLLSEFLDLRPNHDLVARFLPHPHSTSWPGSVTPYEDVAQLWPNHFLDLNTGVPTRFWPMAPIETLDIETCAATNVEYLSNIMCAVAERGPLYLWLTGGYDSRVLFAASKKLHGQMNFCVFDYLKSASYDTSIARKLAKKSGRPIQVVRPKSTPKEFWQLLETNSGGMAIDPGNFTKIAFVDYPADSFHITGTAGEVGRCFYYKNGVRPAALDSKTLCRLAYYDGNPVAEQVFAAWLKEIEESVPPSFGIDPLDLFYWEHRLGAWLGVQCLANDTFLDSIVPFNCRAIFESMLGVGVEYRKEPYLLFRKMCEIGYPEVLDEPFNWTRRWQLEQQFLSMFPWRLRNWVIGLRSSYLGMNYH